MYNFSLHQRITRICQQQGLLLSGDDLRFYTRLSANATAIESLYRSLYSNHLMADALFEQLLITLIRGHQQRNKELRARDITKANKGQWFISNEISGMSLYVDRFCGTLNNLPARLPYLELLGINFLHIMPIFESPAGESDGGYAVSDFRKVDQRFGTIDDLRAVQKKCSRKICT